jgi:oligopeptide/dipeptide ABC transporter ATP-binding protein
VLITHDLGVVAELADRVVVMYAGRVVETADVRAVFHGPRHPYTLGLMTSLPRLAGDDHHLEAIPGRPPSLIDVPSGCPYHPRCQLRQGRQSCVDDVPELVACGQVDQQSACHFHHEVALPPRRVPHPTAGGR